VLVQLKGHFNMLFYVSVLMAVYLRLLFVD